MKYTTYFCSVVKNCSQSLIGLIKLCVFFMLSVVMLTAAALIGPKLG